MPSTSPRAVSAGFEVSVHPTDRRRCRASGERAWRSPGESAARLYVRDVAHRRRVLRVVPGGPKQRCGRRPRYCPDPRGRDAGPTTVDVYGRRLGFVWRYRGRGEGPDHAVLLASLGGRQRTVEHTHGGGLTAIEPLGVAFELVLGASLLRRPGRLPGPVRAVWRRALDRRDRARARRPSDAGPRPRRRPHLCPASTAGGDCRRIPRSRPAAA